MNAMKAHKGWSVAAGVVLILALAGVAGIAGCSGDLESTEGLYPSAGDGGVTTTAAAAMAEEGQGAPSARDDSATGYSRGEGEYAGTLTALQSTSSQKVISDAQLEIEVESGKFQGAFDQALLIADRYGGYVVSSGSYASGDENTVKSGTIAIRVPAATFSKALSDAAKVGEVKNQQIQTQDVTEEYVDIEARITNSKAHVQALLDLLARAKTVDEILQVQQVLTGAQQQLEELEGRLRYLDEHTSYSTLSMTIYEAGAAVTPPGEWGVSKAFKDALHNLVDAVNAIVRGLGILIPVLVVLAIIGYIVYRIWRSAARRQRAREQARYQPYPQGWRGPTDAGGAQPGAGAPGAAQQSVQHQPQQPSSPAPPEGPEV